MSGSGNKQPIENRDFVEREFGFLKVIDDLKKNIQDRDNKISVLEQELERLVRLLGEKDEAIVTLNLKNKKQEPEKNVLQLETRSQATQASELLDFSKEVAELIKAKGILERKNLFLEAEIKVLKQQIKEIKAEKEDLQKQLKCLENKHSQEFAELEGSNLVLEERVDHLEGQNKNLKEDVVDLKKENKDLQEDVVDLKKENKDLQEDVVDLKKEIGVLKRELHMANRPLLVLGELSFQIASLMYQKVIPQWHNRSGSYSVQDIAQDITGLGDEEDKGSKLLAEKTWAELKKELNWKEKYVRSLKTVRYSRNTAAHPPIDEELLYKAAEEAFKNGDLNKDTYDNIMELIGIWKKLKHIK